MSHYGRRKFLAGMFCGAMAAGGAVPAVARQHQALDIAPALMQRALAALERYQGRVRHTDLMAIADFSRPSRSQRLFLVDPVSGTGQAYLVAHGRGSDPGHSGWLQAFSNEPGSYASSCGAYLTDACYEGRHGASLRLDGLEASNSNARPRAIVVHGAWYVSGAMAARTGKIGRSEGCFAVSTEVLTDVLALLGPGRLLYADKA